MYSEEDSFEEYCSERRPLHAPLVTKKVVKARIAVVEPDVEMVAMPVVPRAAADRLGQVFEVAMNRWLPHVEELTFKTSFLDLSRDEASALVRFMRTRDIVGGRVVERETPAEADRAAVAALAARITASLASFPGAKGFVKLSTRSPKDSVFDCFSEKTASLVDEKLRKLPLGIVVDDNAEIGAFFMAANRAMCSNNGEEAVDLFLKSARIRQDLDRALKPEAEEWDMQIVCREFVELPLQSEFRAFVFEGRLTCISQYFWFCYFPELVKRHQAYLNAMTDFFYSQVRHRVPYDSYVIDLAVVGSKVWVIELNPFGDVSGACLFDWREDADVLHGRLSDRPTLRVRLKPMEGGRDRALVPVWDKYLAAKRKPETGLFKKKRA